MFAGQEHFTVIELALDQEVLFRLPPMSDGTVIVRAFHADVTTAGGGGGVPLDDGPPTTTSDSGPARDLTLELRHSEHLSVSNPNLILAESLWVDDFWRLRVRRGPDSISPSSELRRYRIEVTYPSQLLVIERRIPVGAFQTGFELNWNSQQYVSVSMGGTQILVDYTEEISALYGLETTRIDVDLDGGQFRDFSATAVVLGVGAGPSPNGGSPAVFFSVRVDFKGRRKDRGSISLRRQLPGLLVPGAVVPRRARRSSEVRPHH